MQVLLGSLCNSSPEASWQQIHICTSGLVADRTAGTSASFCDTWSLECLGYDKTFTILLLQMPLSTTACYSYFSSFYGKAGF